MVGVNVAWQTWCRRRPSPLTFITSDETLVNKDGLRLRVMSRVDEVASGKMSIFSEIQDQNINQLAVSAFYSSLETEQGGSE